MRTREIISAYLCTSDISFYSQNKKLLMKALLFILIVCFVSCSEAPLKGNIDIEKAMENVSKTPLVVEDYFPEIEYIPLETNDSSVIGMAPHMVVTKDVIVVSSLNQPLKIFDRKTGAFIGDVGSIGQGPKEYAKGGFNEVYFWVDMGTQNIYVQGWNNDFLVYDRTGKYLNKIKVNNEASYNLFKCFFLMDNNKIWGHTKLHTEEDVPSVFCLDDHGNCLNELVTWTSDLFSLSDENLSISTRLGAYIGYGGHLTTIDGDDMANYCTVNSPSLWKSGKDIRLKQAFNDTIYNVTEKGLKPFDVIGLGKWHWEEKDAFQTVGCNDKISVDYILESNDYLYFHLRTGLYDLKNTKVYAGFYDKETKQVSLMEGHALKDEANNQLLSLRGTTPSGGFCALIATDKLSEENITRLKLDEDANPVVVIVEP